MKSLGLSTRAGVVTKRLTGCQRDGLSPALALTACLYARLFIEFVLAQQEDNRHINMFATPQCQGQKFRVGRASSNCSAAMSLTTMVGGAQVPILCVAFIGQLLGNCSNHDQRCTCRTGLEIGHADIHALDLPWYPLANRRLLYITGRCVHVVFEAGCLHVHASRDSWSFGVYPRSGASSRHD